MRFFSLVVNTVGICSLSPPKRFVFALIAGGLSMLLSGMLLSFARPLILPFGVVAQFTAALAPVLIALWFFIRSLRATQGRQLGLLVMLKRTFYLA